MDRADVALVKALQSDSSRSIAELAQLAGMSSSACHRRIKALEEAGLIAGYAAQVDPGKLGLKLLAFVEITLTHQSREAMDRFESAVQDFDDILDCHLMSGSADYLLRVAAADLDQYDRIHRDCLARLPGVSTMRSAFSIRRIKHRRGYPVSMA
ncbi:Lrp/AsnC family transcriptional regulator [Novosphingobium sp. ZN18A2]|uniref:Lrp/AsnC family transcriptional regulator n=1 Tax=Novosphingobium sp. ZN18A2 TaxID=3079861 RepID=UPI0030D28C22